ncbi:hypothetical protein CLV33_101136 [Jejuia pallidilutea]|uniref:Uncharacterized protein n=1 Tax=Jejuia pallidilutea TaxID=504487 RepID=A0A362X3D2_9FLAO|nr:hypothetical protein [Jejuia pallidilutea]PQV51214.1 hypothetical protein CLV33_101136 [Jejuia pallidilutea]
MFGVISILFGAGFFAVNWNRVTQKEKKEIVDALDRALTRTQYHIDNTRTADGENVASTELYDLWNEVANRIRPYDRHNAYTFKAKSKYWLTPNSWYQELDNKDSEQRLKISLSEVTKQYWKLRTIWKIDN